MSTQRGAACVVALGAVSVLAGCSLNFQHLPIGLGVSGDSYPLTLEFADASLLPVGGEVRIGQAVVGRVTSMTADRFAAVVHVEIDSAIELPSDTTARIELSTPIGDAFVGLDVPVGSSATALEPGSVVDQSHTVRGPDVAQLLGAVGTLLNGSGLAQVKSIIHEANQVMDGREDVIRDLLARVDSFLTTVNNRKDSVNSALDSLDRLTATVGDESAVLDEGIKTLTPALKVVTDQRQPLLDLLDQTNRLSSAATAVLDRSSEQIVDVNGKLSPILDQLTAMGPTLDKTMADLDNARALVLRAIPGDYVNIDLDVDIPEVLSGLLNEIIPGAAPVLAPLPPRDPNVPLSTPLEGGTR
ncbi:phospholipid/cholesterol/gamma-HCH transport system substrate-binding protein [Rhodococcus sp. 27YEA15]|uniref:MCE family protein n=1 Tax=Rhodococcus sp. 27YEA15 TaxID=3156259 RepID=UPI003C7E69DE